MTFFSSESENKAKEEIARLERECIYPLKQDMAIVKTQVAHHDIILSEVQVKMIDLSKQFTVGNEKIVVMIEKMGDKNEKHHENQMAKIDGKYDKVNLRLDDVDSRQDVHDIKDTKIHYWIVGAGATIFFVWQAFEFGLKYNWWNTSRQVTISEPVKVQQIDTTQLPQQKQ